LPVHTEGLQGGTHSAGLGRPGCQARRLSIVRGFLTFLQADAPETGVPSPGVLKRPLRATPHIYAEGEVNALLAAVRQLGPASVPTS